MLFGQTTRKIENNAVEMSQAFQDITRFERFTDLKLLEYAFNVIQNWEMDALQFYSMVLLVVMVEGDKSSQLNMAS